jgi:ATP-dependent Clp protease ATP-binding subunit ClpX
MSDDIKPDSPNLDNKSQDKDSEASNKSRFDSPFVPEDLQKEFQELIEKKFGGNVQVMTMGGVPFDQEEAQGSESSSEDDVDPLQDIMDFNYKPREIKSYLDRFVIGQEEAKQALSIAVCDHYNHLKAEGQNPQQSISYQKQNVLVLGPTGVGKTYLIRLISDLIGVPFVKADATRFSEVGYMGANVDDIIRDLVQKANGNKKRAESGIVYVDEVDKLASKKDQMGRDVSGRGVQFGFLRLLENSDVDLNSSHDIASQFKTLMSFQKKGKAEKEIINTKNILFIFSGAFHGLEDIINNRLHKKSIGLHTNKTKQDMGELFKLVKAEDLVQFGFEHEFIGRLPIRVSCNSLSEDQLFSILTQSEDSILHQHIQSFAHYGIKLSFAESALRSLAHKAHQQKTGARALNAVLEELLRPFKFELPSTQITQLEVTPEMVKNPLGHLHHLISGGMPQSH